MRALVVHVAAPAVPGGVSGHVLALLERLAVTHRQHWVLPDRPALAPCAEQARALRLGTTVVESWRRLGVDGHADWLRRLAPDLLHLHFSDPYDLVPVLEAAAGLSLPTVTTDHMVAAGRWGGGDAARRARRRRASRHVAVSIADSQAVADALVTGLGLDPERVRVVHHGVDPRRFTAGDRETARRSLGLDAGLRHLGSVGLLVSAKGTERVVRAMPVLPADVELHLIGDGPERPRLTALALELGARVRFHGWRDDVVTWLRALDLLVHASETEGFPSAILEAMAVGCPVVATAVGGVGELLDGGGRGTLVGARDEAALAAAIARALARSTGAAPDPRVARAQEAARTLYAIDRTAREIDAVHRAVLADARRPAKDRRRKIAGAR